MNDSVTHIQLIRAAVTVAILFLCSAVKSQTFEQSVRAASNADAQYAAALAAVTGRRVQANQAGAAYYPSAAINYNQADVTNGGRSTRSASLTQPLISYDRYLTLQQADPLAALAEADLAQAKNDLALRVFNTMADIVRYREQIRALTVQINGLEEQLRRATRMRDLGQGTVTDVSDFQVRVAIAQANRVSVQNSLSAAERAYTLLTGLKANVPIIEADVPVWADTRNLDELMDYVRQSSPQARTASINVDLARIAVRRVAAQYLPQVSAQIARATTTGITSGDTTRIAITLTAPLGLSPYYDNQRAGAELLRTEETLRYTQDSLTTEITRLDAAVSAYRGELLIRRQAVDGARLSVDANVRSFQGGVKTNIDVITSYQTLADAEVSLVNTRLNLSDAELRLKLLTQGLEIPY